MMLNAHRRNLDALAAVNTRVTPENADERHDGGRPCSGDREQLVRAPGDCDRGQQRQSDIPADPFPSVVLEQPPVGQGERDEKIQDV